MANRKQMARAAEAAAQQAEKDKERKKLMMMLGGALVVFVLFLLIWSAPFMGGKDEPQSNAPTQNTFIGTPSAAGGITEKITHNVTIEIENYGTITAALYGEAAPITVENFVKLADQGFYDGLTFHRIISGFMIQGGDPLGNGRGGSAENIKGEFAANGVNNPIKHERGVLSMARSNAYDSASSQFFIMHDAAPHLDGTYAAFGCVLEGMDVVDAICANTPVTDGNGSVAKADQPRIVSVKVTEVGS